MSKLNWRRMAKDLLYNHPAHLKQIKYGELDIILGSGKRRDNRYRHGGLADPTALTAMALGDQSREWLKKQAAAGEKLVAHLNTGRRPDRNKLLLLQMVYFRFTHSLLGAAAILGISERTAKRWNGEMLEFVAREMGWLD